MDLKGRLESSQLEPLQLAYQTDDVGYREFGEAIERSLDNIANSSVDYKIRPVATVIFGGIGSLIVLGSTLGIGIGKLYQRFKNRKRE